ncbi:MAG TPA: FHA domain-containing protein [Gemmatimonadales bacterium]|nr:FHA domain-containing protein [Gemmatimonadales bacterium]
MALLEMGGRKFTIPAGDVFLGSDPGSAIHLTSAGVLPRHAKLKGQPDGQVVITKAVPEADVLINGVRLGAEPTPLLHGDKVEVAGQELTFVDERRSGSTQYVQAMNLPDAMAKAKSEAKAGGKVTGNTGGRVVSLTDGREYAIAGASLVFGRDATCDVVVSGKDVSRRHAEIVQTPKGYLVVDSSTNGTFVNEVRIEGQRLLARADVIRIGDENFRFYADAAAQANPNPGPAASMPPAVPPTNPSPPPAAPTPAVPPAGAGERLKQTMHGAPGPVLANFLVRSGALKGQRLVVKTPVANIGRADYNDLMIPDESVSTSHAKLQRREGVWVLVDLDSTNGTFVDGERVKGETPLSPGVTVRFGDISLVFEPTDDAAVVAKGGGTRMMEAMKPAAPPPAPKPAAKPAPAPAPAPAPKPKPKAPVAEKKKGKGCGGSAAVLVMAFVAIVYWVLI